MKIWLGGARGSFAVSGPEYARHGGDTFAMLVEGQDGAQLLLDAGSGVRRLRPRLRADYTLYFTHTHLDHLLGLPLLENKWPRQLVLPRGDLAATLARVFSPPIWPVTLSTADYSVPAMQAAVGGLVIRWHEVAHPDGCVAYRVDEPATGESMVVATDCEWPAMAPAAQESFVKFAHGADLLVFDAQYLPEEYPAHRGWGHSTWADAVAVAQRCAAKRLWLIHHKPKRTDAELAALGAAAAAVFPGATVPVPD